jgi:hypothetical protein
MHDLDFIVPAALVAAALAAELLRDTSMPCLARMLARARRVEDIDLPPDAPLAPWQAWLFGRDEAAASIDRVNIAEAWAAAAGEPATTGGRWLAEPAHFTIANDHLRLDDPAALDLTVDEARQLAEAAGPVLAAAGWRLAPFRADAHRHWIVHRDDAASLSAAAIDRAIGENVAAWQPRSGADRNDAAALAWRRCVNEIQMTWFEHPVNAAREGRGSPTVNTLWLSGNGKPATALPTWWAIESAIPMVVALPITSDAPRALETFDALTEPARRGDWTAWRDRLAGLDSRLGVLAKGQATGAIGTLTVVLCGHEHFKVATVEAGDARKFWRSWTRGPSIADLLSEGVTP